MGEGRSEGSFNPAKAAWFEMQYVFEFYRFHHEEGAPWKKRKQGQRKEGRNVEKPCLC